VDAAASPARRPRDALCRRFLVAVFGERLAGVEGGLSSFAGLMIRSSSGSATLGMAAALVMAVLG
jgi:hypothetical protein